MKNYSTQHPGYNTWRITKDNLEEIRKAIKKEEQRLKKREIKWMEQKLISKR